MYLLKRKRSFTASSVIFIDFENILCFLVKYLYFVYVLLFGSHFIKLALKIYVYILLLFVICKYLYYLTKEANNILKKQKYGRKIFLGCIVETSVQYCLFMNYYLMFLFTCAMLIELSSHVFSFY